MAICFPSFKSDGKRKEPFLIRAVHANGKQYASVSELKTAIIYHWNGIDQNTLKSLVRSMPNRVFTLINRSGAYTGY